ncbi:MAG: LPS assembly protein LptD [Desulfobacterota bacterium]|jgi:hypothetical protein|nr:LPS assembly protein LptD [Thermodesulfobacteriota bacterium]
MQRLAILTAVMFLIIEGAASGGMLTVEADRLQREGPRIEALGNVVVTGEDLTLKADYMVYDTDSDDIWATGECSLRDAKGEVRASVLSYNARRKDLHIQDGTLLAYEGSMRISGRSITRYGQDYIQGRSVEFTPCLGSPPDWSLQVEKLDIPIGGYGQGEGVRFMIRRWPVIMFPWFLFPAKLYRHSGLLFPEISHGSDYGYRMGLPVYIALARDVDATITPTWLTDRGLLAKGELRYCLDYDRSGVLYLEALQDLKGGETSDGGVQETIPDRRWFFKAQQAGENLNWDINLASTDDYFRDIGTFINENPLQGEHPSRDLNLLDDSRLEDLLSRAQWVDSRWGVSYALSGQFRQDLTSDDNDQTIQQLPKLTALLRQRSVPFTPLMASAELSTVRISTEDWIEAFKDNAQLEVSLPITVQPYFTIKPYISEYYRDTRFSETKGEYEESLYKEHWLERGASLTSVLYSSRFSGGLEHQVVPELLWMYRSRYGGNEDSQDAQDMFPQILPEDDWVKASDMVVSLGNYIRDDSGRSLADVTVGSVYSHIEDEWREIGIKANLNPTPWLTASHRNVLAREEKDSYATKEHMSRMTVFDQRGDMLTLGYEYNRLDTKLLISDMRVELGYGIAAGFSTRYDHLEHGFTTQAQEISYTSQCWAVQVRRKAEAADEDTPSRTTWSINVKLLGMGDIFQPASAPGKERPDDPRP